MKELFGAIRQFGVHRFSFEKCPAVAEPDISVTSVIMPAGGQNASKPTLARNGLNCLHRNDFQRWLRAAEIFSIQRIDTCTHNGYIHAITPPTAPRRCETQ
jgi:hypothetical protein